MALISNHDSTISRIFLIIGLRTFLINNCVVLSYEPTKCRRRLKISWRILFKLYTRRFGGPSWEHLAAKRQWRKSSDIQNEKIHISLIWASKSSQKNNKKNEFLTYTDTRPTFWLNKSICNIPCVCSDWKR
jgi:hypothetical protein